MKINPPSGPEVARKIAKSRAATADDIKAFYERMAAFLNSIKPPIDAAALHAAAQAAARTSSPDEAAAEGQRGKTFGTPSPLFIRPTA